MKNAASVLARCLAMCLGLLLFLISAPLAWSFGMLADGALSTAERGRDLISWGRGK